ncbi:hypothetical protein [Butyrivibrio sp. AC2005]|uniref:hypothetical protein n=1 Tax=Butyrivibrio sp. AC2005 TaxID=1280672 RepID=UPI000400EBB1|nr:hypothetical protein [Butyrivibrio sp. AC2005]
MEQKRIEGLWDCVFCETKMIRARYEACPNCGKPRGIDTLFYLPDDIMAATLTGEETKKTTNEPDWLCEYCDHYNRSDEPVCIKCGAPRDRGGETYGTIHHLTGKEF